MVSLVRLSRKSAVLTPSALACLSHMPTINLTAGCAHGCIYCYTRGYTNNPGEGRVILYANTLEKLETELARKRTKPNAVYFSPSSDLFQPIPEVLELGHRVLEFLLQNGVGVAFLTKGRIPDRSMKLLLKHRSKVRAQVGVTTVNEDIRRIFEPNAAPVQTRLEQLATLVGAGIATEARLDPVLPGITDTPAALGRLFSALSAAGVKGAAVSTLFLRPAILRSLKLMIEERVLLGTLLSSYAETDRLSIRAERSSVVALDRATRIEIFSRVRREAEKRGIGLRTCACKNPDIAEGTCNIGGAWQQLCLDSEQGRMFDVE